MRGLDEAREFYLSHGAGMIHSLFPEYEGRIAVGLDADLVVFDDDIEVKLVMSNGRIVKDEIA